MTYRFRTVSFQKVVKQIDIYFIDIETPNAIITV